MIGSDTGMGHCNGLRGALTNVFSQILEGNTNKTYSLDDERKKYLGRFTVKLDSSEQLLYPSVISSGSLECSYLAGKVRDFLTTVHLGPFYNQEDSIKKEALKAVFSHILTGQEKRQRLTVGEHLQIAIKVDRFYKRHQIQVTSSESGKDALCQDVEGVISEFIGTYGLLNYFNCPNG